jgi:hypothetical protein
MKSRNTCRTAARSDHRWARTAVPGAKLPAAGFRLLQIRTLLPDHERPLTVGQIDNSYSSFGGGQNWDGVEFLQMAKLTLPQDANTRVAARLSDGSPLLVDRKEGEGHVIVFASALDNVANNLPLQPVWLPFIEQTTHEMGGIGAARTNYRVGSYVDLRTVKEKNVPVEIMGPNDQRLLSLSESAKATTFQFPTQGFFDIRRANGREEMAAVNPDRRESDFTLLTPGDGESVEEYRCGLRFWNCRRVCGQYRGAVGNLVVAAGLARPAGDCRNRCR